MRARKNSLSAIGAIAVASFVFLAPAIASSANYAFTDGQWWDGEAFVEHTVYSVDGVLSFDRPDVLHETIALAGRYVVPPFAEAHNHDLPSEHQLDEQIRAYLCDGVFYVKIQSSFAKEVERNRHRFNQPQTVDAVFAHAPVTGPGGHPIRIREMFFDRGHYEGLADSKQELDGLGYLLIANRSDIERKLPILLSQRPDFVKLVLSNSEEYDLRRDDPEFFGLKGLDPLLVPELVQRAHAVGLRVSAHVNTATDFHHAVVGGVDEVAHLPGSGEFEVIRSADATLAAQKKIVVVTTLGTSSKIAADYPAYYRKVMQQHALNLERLKKAGVQIAIGSDLPYRDTSVAEALLVHELGVFTNAELLRMWTETTSRTIFPGRRIGRLKSGDEASFLVLGGNPLAEFSNVRKIEMRFKQGRPLDPKALQCPVAK